MGARLLVLAKFLQLLTCSHSRLNVLHCSKRPFYTPNKISCCVLLTSLHLKEINVIVPTSLRPRRIRSLVLCLMSTRPSPRVPKSQVPTHASIVPVPVLFTAFSRAFPSLSSAHLREKALRAKVSSIDYSAFFIMCETGEVSETGLVSIFLK